MKVKDAVKSLSALAQESRLEVFQILVREGPEGMCAGDISTKMSIARSTLSFHLRELEYAGMIQSKKKGRSIIYSLKASGVRELFDFLMKDCCQGREDLCQLGRPSLDCC